MSGGGRPASEEGALASPTGSGPAPAVGAQDRLTASDAPSSGDALAPLTGSGPTSPGASSAPLTARGHVRALDGLRGVAILLVLVHNLAPDGPLGSLALRGLAAVAAAGWVGVQLFFVLSGFLITGILLDGKGHQGALGSFLARRLLRILPLYYLALTLYLLVLPRLVPMPLDFPAERAHAVWYWTYLSNWSQPFGRGITGLGHFWSLAVEEQFYLLWPLAVLALSERALARLCGGIMLVAFLTRVLLRFAPPPWTAGNYSFTLTRADALAAGAALALLVRSPRALARFAPIRQRLAWVLGGAFALVVVLSRGVMRHALAMETVGYSILAGLCALLLLSVLLSVAGTAPAGRLRRVLEGTPLVACGKYSYGLYVFHGMLHNLVFRHVQGLVLSGGPGRRLAFSLLYLVAAGAASFALALVSFHGFEGPLLRLKRFFPRRGGAPEPRPAASPG